MEKYINHCSSFGFQVFVIIFSLLQGFWMIRCFLGGLIFYQLNKSAYKKRKKGQTLKESFLYSRFRGEIPKVFITLYFIYIIVHFLSLTASVMFQLINKNELTKVFEFINLLLIFIINLAYQLVYFIPKGHTNAVFPYEIIIPKRRRQKKKPTKVKQERKR